MEDKSLNEKTYYLKQLSNESDVCLYHCNINRNDMDLDSFPLSNLWSVWHNNIIADSWRTFEFATNIKTNSKKVFYLYDIDWHKTDLNYEDQLELINKADLVLCRCQDHQDLIKNRYGIESLVMPSYNYKYLTKIKKELND